MAAASVLGLLSQGLNWGKSHECLIQFSISHLSCPSVGVLPHPLPPPSFSFRSLGKVGCHVVNSLTNRTKW